MQKASSTTRERFGLMSFLSRNRVYLLPKHVSVCDNQNVLKQWHLLGSESAKFTELFEFCQRYYLDIIHIPRSNAVIQAVDNEARAGKLDTKGSSLVVDKDSTCTSPHKEKGKDITAIINTLTRKRQTAEYSGSKVRKRPKRLSQVTERENQDFPINTK